LFVPTEIKQVYSVGVSNVCSYCYLTYRHKKPQTGRADSVYFKVQLMVKIKNIMTYTFF